MIQGISFIQKWTRRSWILIFNPVNYHQVFSDRLGFQSNLSILDLLIQ